MTRPQVIMPNEHFFMLVDEAKMLGADTISVFGYGEPLLDRDICDKIEYCTRQGMRTFITTNGSLLDIGTTYGLFEAGLSHIRFSVHGIFAKDYEAVHHLPFTETLRNIFNFIVLNRKRNERKCETSISTIPMAGESIEDIRAMWEPHVNFLEIWKPHNWTDGRNFRKVIRRKQTCGRPFNGPVQINADGKMMVCCFDYDAKLTVGDTYENTIEEILRSDSFEHIRACHKSGNLEGLICDVCDQLNEGDTPLLYSNRDPEMNLNTTSTTKVKIES